jgi:GWxTD domain-containing protein
MIRRKNLWIILFLFILTARTGATDQTGYRPANEFGEARFAIEAVDFRSEKVGLHDLQVYYKIFYDALSYQKKGDEYVAEYEVALIVEGKDGNQIEGVIREGDISVKTYAETRRASDFVINLVHIPFEKQDITVKAVLTDKLSEATHEAKKELKGLDYWGKYPTLSRVEFCREISPATTDSKFNKGDLRVIPSVTRLFGGDNDSVLTFYQEIYPGETSIKYGKIVNRIYDRIKGYVYSDTVSFGEIDTVMHEVQRINVADLRPGDYELEIRLEGRRGRLYDKLVEPFELELTAESMFRNDYKTAVEMLKYLATREDDKRLKNAKTEAERRKVWDDFWALRDTEKHDKENPTKDEYFRRIRHANRNFSYMRREGWKTTRGMIYITYGQPDEVDDHPFELATKPYQVWLYYRLSPPRKFLFVDEWGDGNYDLQPPYNGLDW